jgi:transposase
MRVGIDAHKKTCTATSYDESKGNVLASKILPTTKKAITEFRDSLPEGTVTVVEASTSGKAVSILLSRRCEVHMLAPPERKVAVKTDRKDAERIIKEDMLGYARRCYVPSPYVEELRSMVGKQMEIGEKISRVKDQIHALIERNMLQSEFSDVSDIFGVEGLERLINVGAELSRQDGVSLAMYLEELRLYMMQHERMEGEFAKIALADEECQLLMSHPGVAPFTAVAMKARIGDASRFPTKKHLCSYGGVVPGADNSGERISEHAHVKRGDMVLKHALTCAVRGAVRAKANSAVKRVYLKQIKRGKSEQEAEVNAARKLACIVWKIITSKRRYVEEDRYLTSRKIRKASCSIRRSSLIHTPGPEDIPSLVRSLTSKTEALQESMEQTYSTTDGRKSAEPSLMRDSEGEMVEKN